MKVRDEIEKYSAPEDKAVLLALLTKYHRESQFQFVAFCRWQRYGPMSYEVNRVWSPTPEGRVLFTHYLSRQD